MTRPTSSGAAVGDAARAEPQLALGDAEHAARLAAVERRQIPLAAAPASCRTARSRMNCMTVVLPASLGP